MPQPVGVGVFGNRPALDVLHHEVGAAVVAYAAVVQPGDVGMLQGGEDLALVAKAAQDLVGVHATLDQLDGDPLLELLVRAVGQVDGAHAAPADLLEYPVRAQALAGCSASLITRVTLDCDQERSGEARGRFTKHHLGLGTAPEKRLDPATKLRVALGSVGHEGFPLGRWPLQGGGEELVDFLPPLGRRGDGAHESPGQPAAVCIEWKSQARARTQSRLIVGTDRPIASAISSKVSPPKKR